MAVCWVSNRASRALNGIYLLRRVFQDELLHLLICATLRFIQQFLSSKSSAQTQHLGQRDHTSAVKGYAAESESRSIGAVDPMRKVGLQNKNFSVGSRRDI